MLNPSVFRRKTTGQQQGLQKRNGRAAQRPIAHGLFGLLVKEDQTKRKQSWREDDPTHQRFWTHNGSSRIFSFRYVLTLGVERKQQHEQRHNADRNERHILANASGLNATQSNSE